MATTPRPAATLESLAARLTAMEAAHARQREAHAREVAALRAELAAVRSAPSARPDGARPRRSLVRLGRAPADPPATSQRTSRRTSRRGMLGTAAKVAVATAAAGVLAEQVGTRAAYADNLGNFSSSDGTTPAVTAAGTNGSDGVYSSSDSGYAIYGNTTSNDAIFGQSTNNAGVNGWSLNSIGVYGTALASGSPAVFGGNYSNNVGSIAVLGHCDDGSIHGGLGQGIGVQGETGSGTGVNGTSLSGDGVAGTTGGTSASGVHGVNTSNVSGSIAVLGHSDNGSGSLGPGIGVLGETAGGYGVYGKGTTGYGVVAQSGSGTAVSASSGTGSAVVASSSGVGYGLYLTAPSGWAIGCNGRIRVLGSAFGTVTLAGGTTTKTVVTTACSGGSLVILTPQSDPGARVWAVAAPGAFTVRASAAPATNVTFTYLLIN